MTKPAPPTADPRKDRALRAKLRAQGLRPVVVWVRDTSAPGFAEEARRQSLAMAESDRQDKDLQDFMNAAWADLDED